MSAIVFPWSWDEKRKVRVLSEVIEAGLLSVTAEEKEVEV
jgi:hypothetical protein